MRKRKAYIGFIAPGFVIYTLLMIIPIGCAVYYSFFNWSGIGPMEFIGLGNFKKLFTDARMSGIFFNALKNNMKYLLCVLFIVTPLQIFFAYMIYIKIRGHKYIRLMLFLPYVISTSIAGFLAILLLDPNIGVFNEILGALGGQNAKRAWLGDPDMVFKIFVCVVIWQCIGAGMMIFYANMQEISDEIVEAAVIDGAGEIKKFFYVIFPMMKSSMSTNITLSVIYALTMFDIPYILVGPQGGVNNKLDFVNMVFYRYAFGGSYFGETSIGFGSSISVTMFVIIMVFSLVTSRLMKRFGE
ncbi:MAG: sugar ABC transporter permease [Eubacteriales bacterium]|nr:sugar ABC transporter permease [Eubacteriales bacterium]